VDGFEVDWSTSASDAYTLPWLARNHEKVVFYFIIDIYRTSCRKKYIRYTSVVILLVVLLELATQTVSYAVNNTTICN